MSACVFGTLKELHGCEMRACHYIPSLCLWSIDARRRWEPVTEVADSRFHSYNATLFLTFAFNFMTQTHQSQAKYSVYINVVRLYCIQPLPRAESVCFSSKPLTLMHTRHYNSPPTPSFPPKPQTAFSFCWSLSTAMFVQLHANISGVHDGRLK